MSSLSLNLFLLMFGVIILAFATYAFFSFRQTSGQWEQSVYKGAQRFSELIQHSTHYSMLLNRKEDVHHIIRTIAESPGVEGVRIYDKSGAIIFSAKTEEIGTRVDLQAEACVSCHDRDEPLHSVPAAGRRRIYTLANGERVLGLINPIENAPDCSTAACHAHPPEQNILGVLDVKMSMAEPDAAMARARSQAMLSAVLVALLVGLLSALFISRLVRRPVRELIRGTRRVANGELTTAISVRNRNEIGQLATAFNTMTRDLDSARRELTEWSQRLEEKLEEKTAELSEKQRQVSHMDKMASLGKLAATVAHELNNPLAGILNYAKLVGRTLNESETTVAEADELRRYLALIQSEASRSGTIVRSLLAFSRRSGAEFGTYGVNAILERAVMLVRHHMEVSGIRFQMTPASDDLQIVCDPDLIQQAMVALMVNAVEAMPDGGTLRLTAKAMNGTWVELSVEDTGVGIPTDALPHLFEPFYSSKKDPKGAGLGLSVAYGIVQRHSGRIDVESKVGKGTIFRVVLPLRQPIKPEEQDGQMARTAFGSRSAPQVREGV